MQRTDPRQQIAGFLITRPDKPPGSPENPPKFSTIPQAVDVAESMRGDVDIWEESLGPDGPEYRKICTDSLNRTSNRPNQNHGTRT